MLEHINAPTNVRRFIDAKLRTTAYAKVKVKRHSYDLNGTNVRIEINPAEHYNASDLREVSSFLSKIADILEEEDSYKYDK